MKWIKGLFIVAGLLGNLSLSYCQTIEVSVPSLVTEGESFTLEFTLNDGEIDDFDINYLGGFEVIGGPNRSSSLSIINGKRSSKTSISYILLATQPGSVTIPSVTFTVRGKKIFTKPVTVTVQKAQNSGGRDFTGSGANDIFLRTSITPSSKMFLGQQALLSYDIYFRTGINLGNNLNNPDLSAFYYRDFGSSLYNETQTKNINGKVYNYATVEKGALFAQKVGKFNIGRMKKSIGIEKGIEQDSDFGFFSRKVYDPAVVESDQAIIEVIPLPENAPGDFINGVGKYTGEIFVEKSPTGYFLVLRLTGNGDERSLITPKLAGNADVEIYNGTKINSEENFSGDYIVHTTVYQYPVVFKKEGDVSFNCSLSYFDTDTKKYEKINLPVNYNVTQVQVNSDFQSVKTTDSSVPSWVAGLIGALIAGLLALAILFWYQKNNKKSEDDGDLDSVKKETKTTELHTIKYSSDPFNEAKNRVLKKVHTLYNIEPKDQNRSYIYNYLTRIGKEEEARKIDAVLELCEQAVYGGNQNEIAREKLVELMKGIS
jgi:hypothetical protein